TVCDRFFHELLAIDATPVVMYVDQDLVSGLARGNGEEPDLALAGLQTLGWLLDAVIDCVPNDVCQWITDHFDHLAVELDVAALDIDEHLLAELRGEIANHAR